MPNQRRPTMTAARYVGPQAASSAVTGGAAHPLDDETDHRDWYEHTYLPLVRRYFAGEYIDPTLLRGGTLQESDDLKWDQRNGDDWATG